MSSRYHSSKKYPKFVVYLVVVVLMNVAGLTLFARLDLTAGKLYSISDVSREVVSTLTEPLTINVFFTKNLPAPHNNTERYLQDLLAEYADTANDYFNYRFYDVSPDQGDLSAESKENQSLASNYGINPIQIQVIEKDEVKFQKAYMGLVIIHGDQIEKIPTITSTDGLEYKLTMAIRKLNNKVSALLALEDKVQVNLYQSSSLNAVAPFMRLEGLADIPQKVEEIVSRLNSKSYGKLAFKYLDPSVEEGLEGRIDQYRLMKLNWPNLDDGKVKAGKGTIGLVMSYGGKAVSIPLLQVIKIPIIGTQYRLADLGSLEDAISANVESLIDINQNIGILQDFGSLPVISSPPPDPMGRPQQAAQNFRAQVGQNYSLRTVNLKDGTVPEEFNCLIIPGPKEKFSDYDLFQIDQFLMKGKSLAVIFDPLKEVQTRNQNFQMGGASLSYLPLNSGLEKLLAHYGVSVHPSVIMDENCFKQQLPREMGGGERPIYFAPLIKNQNINNQLSYLQNIKGLIAVKASPITLDHERFEASGLKAHSLVRSSEKSWEVKERINLNPAFIRPPAPDTERQQFSLAYMIEGEFPSYFADKPIPEKPKEETPGSNTEASEPDKGDTEEKPDENLAKIEGAQQVIKKGKPGKLFVLTSTEMIQDSLMDKAGRGANDIFIMNILDYLNDQSEVAVMRSKQQRFNPLNELEAFTKTAVKTINIVGLPILVVVFGLLVWVRRHSRKKQIQIMFMK
jgi:ABC-type uncharacterized transport system involved in gliding motility auxiliary subunit